MYILITAQISQDQAVNLTSHKKCACVTQLAVVELIILQSYPTNCASQGMEYLPNKPHLYNHSFLGWVLAQGLEF